MDLMMTTATTAGATVVRRGAGRQHQRRPPGHRRSRSNNDIGEERPSLPPLALSPFPPLSQSTTSPLSPRRQYASRFVEGSMSDRTSCVPPVAFLGSAEALRQLDPASAAEAGAESGRMSVDGIPASERPAFSFTTTSTASATSSSTSGSALSAHANRRSAGFFAPLWNGVSRRLHRHTRSAAVAAGSDSPLTDAPPLAADTAATAAANTPLQPSPEEVLASYQQLMQSGFFGARAIPAARPGLGRPGAAGTVTMVVAEDGRKEKDETEDGRKEKDETEDGQKEKDETEEAPAATALPRRGTKRGRADADVDGTDGAGRDGGGSSAAKAVSVDQTAASSAQSTAQQEDAHRDEAAAHAGRKPTKKLRKSPHPRHEGATRSYYHHHAGRGEGEAASVKVAATRATDGKPAASYFKYPALSRSRSRSRPQMRPDAQAQAQQHGPGEDDAPRAGWKKLTKNTSAERAQERRREADEEAEEAAVSSADDDDDDDDDDAQADAPVVPAGPAGLAQQLSRHPARRRRAAYYSVGPTASGGATTTAAATAAAVAVARAAHTARTVRRGRELTVRATATPPPAPTARPVVVHQDRQEAAQADDERAQRPRYAAVVEKRTAAGGLGRAPKSIVVVQQPLQQHQLLQQPLPLNPRPISFHYPQRVRIMPGPASPVTVSTPSRRVLSHRAQGEGGPARSSGQSAKAALTAMDAENCAPVWEEA